MSLLTHPLVAFLGFRPTGDVGDITIYTSRRQGVVYFLKAPPTTPPTPTQLHQRNRFTQAAAAWRETTQAKRADWENATKAAHLRLTGYNLFVYWMLTGDRSTIETIERYSGIPLL